MFYDYFKLGIEIIGEDIRSNIKVLQKMFCGYGYFKEFFLDVMIKKQENVIKCIEV